MGSPESAVFVGRDTLHCDDYMPATPCTAIHALGVALTTWAAAVPGALPQPARAFGLGEPRPPEDGGGPTDFSDLALEALVVNSKPLRHGVELSRKLRVTGDVEVVDTVDRRLFVGHQLIDCACRHLGTGLKGVNPSPGELCSHNCKCWMPP